MEKKSALLLAQVDHASGEVLGFAVERIMERGAHNVQLIPTITKKSRPGHILLIDAAPESHDAIAEFLVRELKVAGYHRIDTTHVLHPVTYAPKKFTVKIREKTMEFQCTVKLVGDPGQPLCMDVEHDFLVGLQNDIRETMDRLIPLDELRTLIESKLLETDEVNIEM